MSSVSDPHMSVKPVTPVAAINKAADKLVVKAGGSNKLTAIPQVVAAVNQAAQVKPLVKGANQKK